ncbi:hypothetical protein AMELA_G00168790 [Ameiurus melas]|uniref:Uncharacterized protein n=1 Tax=Ameiurus melas TaxID=219545 RepID=A0A7J6ABT4_AMEME|nr:hypothetical protein AMELA_G00168790 [Ameiurus melas]
MYSRIQKLKTQRSLPENQVDCIKCPKPYSSRKRKTDKADFVPVQTKTAYVPREEDWEQEIEELSRRTEEKEKETSTKTPYGSKNFQALAVPMKGLGLLLVV